MTDHSETLGALFDALAKAQGEIRRAAENARNPHLKNRYADLGAVWDAARPVLAKHEIAVSQWPIADGERAGVRTYLGHSSGEYIAGDLMMTAAGSRGVNPAQAVGIAISYARRYALAAAVGITTGEDTDGAVPAADAHPDRGQAHPDRGQAHPDRREKRTAAPAKDAPAKDAPAKKGHDPSWEADRPRFCAWAGDHGGYDLVRDWCKAEYGMKPSELPQMRRDSMRRFVDSDAGQDSLSGFRDHVVKGTK